MGETAVQGLRGGMLAAREQIEAAQDAGQILTPAGAYLSREDLRRIEAERAGAGYWQRLAEIRAESEKVRTASDAERQAFVKDSLQAREAARQYSAALGGIRGGIELARLGSTESLAIGETARGIKLSELLPPAAFGGLQDTLGAAALDFTRGVGLRMQEALGAAILNVTQPVMLGAVQYMSEWADTGARAALESLTAGLERQYAETFGAIGRWAEEQQREQEQMLAAFADIGRLSAWPEPAPRRQPYLPSKTPIYQPSPSRAPRRPEPPSEPLDVAQIPEPDWQAAITLAIKQGKVSPAELIKLALQHNHKAPGLIPPEWAEIEAVALAYKEHGHRYDSQEAFIGYLVRRGFSLSLATFKRWLNLYETVTGEYLRPGRGRRKRNPPKRPFVS